MIAFEGKDIGWIFGVIALLGGGLIAWIRYRLSGDFARATDVTSLGARVTAMEQRLSQMPNHEDLRQLQVRVAEVERGVAVVAERVAGLGEIMKRVEHQTGLLVQHQLRERED